jgi:hypothetical protein
MCDKIEWFSEEDLQNFIEVDAALWNKEEPKPSRNCRLYFKVSRALKNIDNYVKKSYCFSYIQSTITDFFPKKLYVHIHNTYFIFNKSIFNKSIFKKNQIFLIFFIMRI